MLQHISTVNVIIGTSANNKNDVNLPICLKKKSKAEASVITLRKLIVNVYNEKYGGGTSHFYGRRAVFAVYGNVQERAHFFESDAMLLWRYHEAKWAKL